MAKQTLKRTRDTSRIEDEDLKVSKHLSLPVFEGAPTLNGNDDSVSAVGINADGRLVIYDGLNWRTVADFLGQNDFTERQTIDVDLGDGVAALEINNSAINGVSIAAGLSYFTQINVSAYAGFGDNVGISSSIGAFEFKNISSVKTVFNFFETDNPVPYTVRWNNSTHRLGAGNFEPFAFVSEITSMGDANYVKLSDANLANGYAQLDTGGLLPASLFPDAILGNVKYKGTYNGAVISSDDSALNGAALPSAATGNKGYYFICSADFILSGVDYKTGDWILSNGAAGWTKIDNSDAVTTVFGRLGNVVANEADYQSFYPRLSQTYANPSWITSLAASKISGLTSGQIAYSNGTGLVSSPGLFFDGSNLGVGISASLAAAVHVKSAGAQLRLEDAGGGTVTFTVAGGNFTANRSGGQPFVFSGGIATSAGEVGGMIYRNNWVQLTDPANLFDGTAQVQARDQHTNTNATAVVAGQSAAAFLLGANRMQIASSGNHLNFAGLAIMAPNISATPVGGTGTLTNAASLMIMDAPLNAINSAAIWVRAGLSRFDGGFRASGSSRFDFGSDAEGDIYYRNSSGNLTRLPRGTNGQVLTLVSGVPAWV